ncbi:hypothetical protein ACQP2T_53585 [Nonomuraea sp. CA-143628]|uniref:hypothetical protein n=1 Tax=Nonomuraea sp. CA-143628 TaxID=3239997 RepID=UPI003D8E09C1
MSAPNLASDGMAVVLPGEFDPLLITPRWLRKTDLIGAEDYESYSVEIISSGVTAVSFGSIQLRVTPDVLQIATNAVIDVEAARDLAAGILLSKGAPTISALGINRMVHFEATLEEYHAIGDALTPKDSWADLLHLPGMLNLTIRGVRDDGYGGSINTQIQPSKVARPGVFVSINDHYNLTYAEVPTDRNSLGDPEEGNPQRSADKVPVAVKILTDGFSASRNNSQAIIDRVASLRVTAGKSR